MLIASRLGSLTSYSAVPCSVGLSSVALMNVADPRLMLNRRVRKGYSPRPGGRPALDVESAGQEGVLAPLGEQHAVDHQRLLGPVDVDRQRLLAVDLDVG